MTAAELERYSRQLVLPQVGVEGQRRLRAARVLCVGAGGLGSPAALYLAAAGVGTIGIADFDRVDVSNLQRQIIHSTADVGRPKLDSARDRLRNANPDVQVELHPDGLTVQNGLGLVSQYDVVLDGTDNFPTRYLVNDACVMAGRPNAFGSVLRFEGQAAVLAAPDGPCYRCLHPEPPPAGVIPSCAEAGVLGVLPGLIGMIQATETLKIILGLGRPLIGRFLIYDALRMRFREIHLPKDPDCPVCGIAPAITTLQRYELLCDVAPHGAEITAVELAAALERSPGPFVLDVREPAEYAICRLPRSVLIPLGELPARLDEIPRSGEIVVHCKSGVRSARAAAFLREQGFARVRNLSGGILGWIDVVDSRLTRY